MAVERVTQVELPADGVLPSGGVGVLEVRQPDLGARVQRVDRHLPVDGTGDLHPAVHQSGRGRGDVPLGLAHVPGLGQEVEGAARRQLGLAGLAGLQQLQAPAVELTLEGGHEGHGLRREDLVEAVLDGAADLHTVHGSSFRKAFRMVEK
ncbi:hypothetical protein GCM10018952_53210 [Streptosporangium vulgare]